MNNIFENAYFGKPYKTRDGRKAIYAGVLPSITLHRLLIEGTIDTFNYNEFGEFKPHGSSVFDIVSEWQEERRVVHWHTLTEEEKSELMLDIVSTRKPINEEELDRLALQEYAPWAVGLDKDEYMLDEHEKLSISAFKAGHRKAMED